MPYINENIGYYVGDKISPNDIDVIERPDEFHEYINSEWVFNEILKRASIPTLSKWDVRKILTKVGLRAAVEAFIATSTQENKDAWECAADYERLDPVLAAAALALGISDDQLDQMWALKGTV